MRGLAETFAAAGYSVELPRLPGHGTSPEDMVATDWDDWSEAAETAFKDLAARTRSVIVCGLSMGEPSHFGWAIDILRSLDSY